MHRLCAFFLVAASAAACTAADLAPTALDPTATSAPTAVTVPTDGDDGPASGPPHETTSSTTAPTTTPTAPGADTTTVCLTLAGDDYGHRRRARTGLDPAMSAEIRAVCPDALAAAERADAVRAAVDAIPNTPVTATLRSCTARGAALTAVIDVENTAPLTMGLLGTIRVTGDGAAPAASFVQWRLPDGPFELVIDGTRLGSGGGSCELRVSAFVADPTLDGGDPPTPATGARAADDPATWLPALFAAEAEWQSERDADAVGSTEDLRSLDFADLVLGVGAGTLPESDAPAVTVCTSTGPASDADRRVVVWSQDAGDGASVAIGVFRRGDDGAWRWLGDSRTILADGTCDDLR